MAINNDKPSKKEILAKEAGYGRTESRGGRGVVAAVSAHKLTGQQGTQGQQGAATKAGLTRPIDEEDDCPG